MYVGLYVNCPLFLPDCNETGISSTDFRKKKLKFHENPSSGSRALPCGRIDRHEDNIHFSEFCERIEIREHPSSTSCNSSQSLDPPISFVLTGTVALRLLGVERDDVCNRVEVQR